MDDLVQRLRLFEEYMKHERQDYPAELLHRTIDRIERLERESDEDIRNCEKQLAERDRRIERLEAALRWMVNVAHGVGKAGGEPFSGEWEDALAEGRRALDGEVDDG